MQVGDSRTVKGKGKLKDEMKNHGCFLISLFLSSINLFLWLTRWIANFPSVFIDAFVLIRTSWNLVQNLGVLETHVWCLSYTRQSKETYSYVFSNVEYILLSCTMLIQLSVKVYEHMCISVITCFLGCLRWVFHGSLGTGPAALVNFLNLEYWCVNCWRSHFNHIKHMFDCEIMKSKKDCLSPGPFSILWG